MGWFDAISSSRWDEAWPLRSLYVRRIIETILDLMVDCMPSPCPPHGSCVWHVSGNCTLCLKPRHTYRKPWRCSNKPLSCLFEGNMAHELHKPENIYRSSEPFPEDAPRVQGYNFNQGVDHKALLQSFYNTGFQATHFGRAVREINRMVRRLKPAKIIIIII